MNTKNKLYFVDINKEQNRLLALDLQIRSEENGITSVSFYDTNRGRGFYGEIVRRDPQTTVFRTEQGDELTFRVATVQEYDYHWRRYIEGNVPIFSTDEELHIWYIKHFL